MKDRYHSFFQHPGQAPRLVVIQIEYDETFAVNKLELEEFKRKYPDGLVSFRSKRGGVRELHWDNLPKPKKKYPEYVVYDKHCIELRYNQLSLF